MESYGAIKIVNGLGLELTGHLILEVGFGRLANQTGAQGMSSVHKLVGGGTDGMIQNATSKHTLYAVIQVIFRLTCSQSLFKILN